MEQVTEKFEKIGGDLDKLIDDYSNSDNGPGIKSLISWLEIIKQSAHEGKEAARFRSVPEESEASAKPITEHHAELSQDNISGERPTPLEIPSESSPVRVLAVDSQDVIRELLTSMLSGMGYDSLVVSESGEAIDEFQKAMDTDNRFGIVVADNILDKLSGMELSAKLKEIDPEISFILITGWGQEPEYSELEKNMVDRVLRKPFRIEQLSHVIGDLLRERSSA